MQYILALCFAFLVTLYSKTQDEDVVDKVMSQYNIEEFYGLEAVIEPEEAPPKEDLVPISLESKHYNLARLYCCHSVCVYRK